MFDKGKIANNIITAAVFIVLEIAAVGMLKYSGPLQDIWLTRLSHRFMAVTWGAGKDIKAYFSLKEQNQSLLEENFKLKSELNEYKEKHMLSASDSLLSSISLSSHFQYIPASVVKISKNRQHNYFIIDKGYEDGLDAQSGIITGNGALGIIDAVDKHHSYCISFMNPSSSISARIGSEGSIGPLIWDGLSAKGAIMKDIPLHSQFAQGDTIFTSGYSSIFPADIPLGTIESSKVINGAVYDIKVNLFQDFSSVRYVMVVVNTGRDEILNLERLEEGSQQ